MVFQKVNATKYFVRDCWVLNESNSGCTTPEDEGSLREYSFVPALLYGTTLVAIAQRNMFVVPAPHLMI